MVAAFSFAGAFGAQAAVHALGEEKARLLLTLAGFASTGAEVPNFAPLDHAQTVDRLLP
jgi:hypothetical protein